MIAPPLITVSWLTGHLSDATLRVIDIRSSGNSSENAFDTGHIPGAVHSDYAADGWRIAQGGAGGLLPDPAALAHLLGRLGITPENHVVIVSAGLTPADFSGAARVCWTLKIAGHDRVSILDGGFEAWRLAGQPIETGPSASPAGAPYPVRIKEVMRATVGDIDEAITHATAALLDGRSRAQYEGHEKSPQAARAGRLPGAVHLDHSQAFAPGTGRLRPAAELEQLFGSLPSGPVVSYCNTGHLASTNWFVLSEVLGRTGITLYDGSMSEWTQDPGRPVATGAAEGGGDH